MSRWRAQESACMTSAPIEESIEMEIWSSAPIGLSDGARTIHSILCGLLLRVALRRLPGQLAQIHQVYHCLSHVVRCLHGTRSALWCSLWHASSHACRQVSTTTKPILSTSFATQRKSHNNDAILQVLHIYRSKGNVVRIQA